MYVGWGENVILEWDSDNATSCNASIDWSGGKPVDGSENVGPQYGVRTFQIHCYNDDGNSRFDWIDVISSAPPPPTVDLKEHYSSCDSNCGIPYGDYPTLRWSSTDASSCTASGDWSGGKGTSGVEPQPQAPVYTTRSFTLECSGSGGSASDTVTMYALLPPPPTVDLLCNATQGPCTVPYNSNVTLSWSSSNADSCSASGAWSGSKPLSGSESQGPITSTRTYTLTCSNVGGSTPDSVTVQNPPNQTPLPTAVTVDEPDYCNVGPSATVRWTFTDPDLGNTQSAYRVQVDDNAGYSNPELDTGKIVSVATTYSISQGILTWNTTYRARVRVWDNNDAVSNWVEMSVCNGPPGNPSGCAPNNQSWKTPQHSYPSAGFSWNPLYPIINQIISFKDKEPYNSPYTVETQCYKTPPNTPDTCNEWRWNFGDGTSLTGVYPTPTHTYTNYGNYTVTFQVKDEVSLGVSYVCPVTPLAKTIIIQKPAPKWKEVLPQ